LRELFDGLRWLVRAGCPWRMMPNDLPPRSAVYQQTQRWLKAGCFEAMAHDLRAIVHLALDRKAEPSAAILDSRTLQSTPESGRWAGFDGHKKRKGSKVHLAGHTMLYITRRNASQLFFTAQSIFLMPVSIESICEPGPSPAADCDLCCSL